MKLLSGGNFFWSCYPSMSVQLFIMTAQNNYRKPSRFRNGYDCPVTRNQTVRHNLKFPRGSLPLDYPCVVSLPGHFLSDCVWYLEFLFFPLWHWHMPGGKAMPYISASWQGPYVYIVLVGAISIVQMGHKEARWLTRGHASSGISRIWTHVRVHGLRT